MQLSTNSNFWILFWILGEPDAIANLCYMELSERKPFQELFWDIWRSSNYSNMPTQTNRSASSWLR